ncbi:N-acetyltransferase family protein [Dethiothermospora halolimnae]|uniref:GNAT family N-acetyltransferase n=1 Tax=Dethiothermospora halolimnae TaxID=3114390 RepID=UPI003CCBCEDE
MLIRKAVKEDAKEIININHKTWRIAYRGIVSQEFMDKRDKKINDKITKMSKQIKNNQVNILVAEEDEKVIGFVSYGKSRENRYESEVYAIYVLKEYQKRGVGKKLIKKVIENLIKENYSNIIIWCLKDNKYKKFYEEVGGQPRENKVLKIGNKQLDTIGYGFYNLNKVMEKLG